MNTVPATFYLIRIQMTNIIHVIICGPVHFFAELRGQKLMYTYMNTLK